MIKRKNELTAIKTYINTRWFLFAALLICYVLPAPDMFCADKSQSVLFVSAWKAKHIVEPEYMKSLHDRGWQVGYCALKKLTIDKLKQFNCVVLFRHPEGGNDALWSASWKKLLEYVSQGGGMLIFTDLYRNQELLSLNQELKPLGISVVPYLIRAKDKSKIISLPHYPRCKAQETTDILSSALTAGVTKLFYPSGDTWPLIPDSQWKVAVRGGVNTRDVLMAGYKSDITPEKNPPILAYRQYGKGRLALFSTNSMHWVTNPNHFFYDGFFLKQGGEKLLDNIYKWLSGPSLESGIFGGFKMKNQKSIFTFPPPRKIRKINSYKYDQTLRKGLIGAHTKFSGGRYSVTEFCEKAKALGYDFLVFTENGKMMENRAKWNSYAEECKKNTTKTFIAVPGIQFTGLESGDKGIIFNMIKPWPLMPWRGKGFNSFIRLGCMNRWNRNIAQIFPGKNPIPFYILGADTCMTLFSYKNGKLTDDYSSWYCKSAATDWKYRPLTYHEIWDPNELSKLSGSYHTYTYSSRWGVRRSKTMLHSFMVGNGPLIERFKIVSDGSRYSPYTGKSRITLRVSSSLPLKQVKLFFNENLVRCFRPESKNFEGEVELFTNQRGFFYLVVEDAGNRKAYSGGLVLGRNAFGVFIGTDRMNGYCYPRDEKGNILGTVYPALGWGEHFYFSSRSQKNHPVGTETGPPPGGVSRLYTSPLFYTSEGREFTSRGTRPALWRRIVLNSTDCVVLKDTITRQLSTTRKDGIAQYELKEAKFLKAEVKIIAFRWKKAIRLLVETCAEGKKSVSIINKTGTPNPSFIRFSLGDKPAAYGRLAYLASSGKTVCLVPGKKVFGKLPKGGFVRMGNHPFGTPGVFCFQKSCFSLHGRSVSAGDNLSGEKLSPGRKISGRYLFLITQGGADDDPERIFSEIYDKSGFDGKPAYDIRLRHGKVIDKTYAPLLEAADYFVSGEFTGAKVVDPLGLVIANLNPNWDAGLVDLDNGKLLKRVAVCPDDKRGYLLMDTSQPQHLMIGNLITADNPDVIINVLAMSPDKVTFTVHNPLGRTVETKVEFASGIKKRFPVRKCLLKPGETKSMTMTRK